MTIAAGMTPAAMPRSHSRSVESSGSPSASMSCGSSTAKPRSAGMTTATIVRSTRWALYQISVAFASASFEASPWGAWVLMMGAFLFG